MKIVSGGQTGADRAALEIAKELGIETGGWAPMDWRTDTGPDPSLAEFGLRQADEYYYPQRTRWNVRDSDATVLFGDTQSAGCRATIRYCRQLKRPYLENPKVEQLVDFCRLHNIQTLNVAGNRARTNPVIIALVREVLRPALIALSQERIP